MSEDPVIVNLCPTGMVPRRATVPHVPVTPAQIAADVARCVDAGASMVHLHARGDDEAPTWRRERFEEIVAAVVDRAPEVIIVVTTSGRDWQDVDRRAESLDVHEAARPEMASLTLGSMNFPTGPSVNAPETIAALASRMRDRGIVPELEIFDVGMANVLGHLRKTAVLADPTYVNILWGSRGTADLSAINIAAVLAALPAGSTWAFAGIGRFQLRANTMAMALGGHVRVGLEDNPYEEWAGRTPATNPRLVERVVKIGRALGREPASAARAREIIGLPVPHDRARPEPAVVSR
nr:3-keto-5-aminohexanoate cleavage protein [Cellulomonas triticagri]